MADDLRVLANWFTEREWPTLPCPTCKVGGLHPMRDNDGSVAVRRTQSGASVSATSGDDWEPEYWIGVFNIVYECGRTSCRERVLICGDWCTEWIEEVEGYGNCYRVHYANPAVPLVIPPSATPKAVTLRLEEASRVVWADPASGANALRRCVEAVLDHQRVNKTAPRKGGGRRRLTTQERITAFKSTSRVAGTSLEAVKWVGNQGSHATTDLTAVDCIESAEHLDLALRVLYDTRDAQLLRRARGVNQRRGVKRR